MFTSFKHKKIASILINRPALPAATTAGSINLYCRTATAYIIKSPIAMVTRTIIEHLPPAFCGK
jgi:hypothetical protein